MSVCCALVWLPAALCYGGSALPAGVPRLDEMAGNWLPMKDVANPPDVNNFHDMLLINRDLTSFFCNPEDWLWAWGDEKFHFGYPPVTLAIAGKEYPATECRWCPYRALRRNPNCAGFAVQTDTRMINEQRAVLVRIQIANPGTTKTNIELTLSVSGILRADGVSVFNTSQRPGFVTVICPATKPDEVDNSNGTIDWSWNVSLRPGSKKEIEFVAGDGHAADAPTVQADVMHWAADFSEEFDGFKQCWEQRWADAFTPGNHHFSGSLPVLVTDNAALKRNYYMGILTMLELERTQFPVSPRSFITSGERAPGTQFYWDASMQSTVWALLEPAGMKATLRRWLVQNVRSGSSISITETNGFDTNNYDRITGYAFNACTIFKAALDYLRVTGDTAFLDEKLEDGKTVLQRMDEMATDWQTLVRPGSPLADYGENRDLLECAPAYIGRVPSCNAQNIWMMRQDAALQELKGNAIRARDLHEDAEKLLPAVLSLYKSGDGVWYGLHNDGMRVELRHCVDYIYVGNALASDLTPDMRRQMTDFVKRELLMRHWMRAMSLQDAAAAVSDRPDHGPMGAYDGWPALTVGTMWRLGFPSDAFDFYCRTAAVTKEGPFAQAREFYGPHRDQYDAPVRIAEREGCMKECISGAAFADVVVNTFFGFMPSLDGKNVLADPQTPRPFSGKLLHVSCRGERFTISAGAKGVSIHTE
ncbi:MAG TPA: hypothetical protein VME24_12895 [Alphaproteobacteria bacterium]|nr:hypothetical protein [Alphaproteobacteria bacterium]